MTEAATTAQPSVQDLITEFYQGEVFGEAFLVELLGVFSAPSEQYKLGTMLQLETETKARIRPVEASQRREHRGQVRKPPRGR